MKSAQQNPSRGGASCCPLPRIEGEPTGALQLRLEHGSRFGANPPEGLELPEQIDTAASWERHAQTTKIPTAQRDFVWTGQAGLTGIYANEPWTCWRRRILYLRMVATVADVLLEPKAARKFWRAAGAECAHVPFTARPWRWWQSREIVRQGETSIPARLIGGDSPAPVVPSPNAEQ